MNGEQATRSSSARGGELQIGSFGSSSYGIANSQLSLRVMPRTVLKATFLQVIVL